MTDCCKTNNSTKKCIRKEDNKVFTFPRRFSRKKVFKFKTKRIYDESILCSI